MPRVWEAPLPAEEKENEPLPTTEWQNQKLVGKISPPGYSRSLDFSKINTQGLKNATKLYHDRLPPITGAMSQTDAFEEFDQFCERKILIQYADYHMEEQGFGISTDPAVSIKDHRMAVNLQVIGIKQLNALQRKTIPLIRDGYCLLVMAPTGIGKTYAFLIPAIERVLKEKKLMGTPKSQKPSPYVLIMTNTGTLIKQLQERCCALLGAISKEGVEEISEIKTDLLIGGTHFGHGQCDIAFATMGKLQATIEQGGICLDNLKMIILDEADKMVDDSSFGREVMWVFEQLNEEVKSTVQCCFFSATYLQFDGAISMTSVQLEMVGEKKHAVVVCPRKPGYITQKVIKVPRGNRGFSSHSWIFKMSHIKVLIDQDLEENGCSKEGPHFKQTMVIFCETVGRVNQVTAALRLAGYNFKPMSRLVGKVQQEVTKKELAQGIIHGVVCTNVLARGVDISTIRHTIVMEMSRDMDTYKHRIGRVGRDGTGGTATVFVEDSNLNGSEAMVTEGLVHFMHENQQFIPEWLNKWYKERIEAQEALSKQCSNNF